MEETNRRTSDRWLKFSLRVRVQRNTLTELYIKVLFTSLALFSSKASWTFYNKNALLYTVFSYLILLTTTEESSTILQPVSKTFVSELVYWLLPVNRFAFSALTLLVGRQEGHRPVKNWVVGYWHGYLSGAICRLAYGPADATATHCLLFQ